MKTEKNNNNDPKVSKIFSQAMKSPEMLKEIAKDMKAPQVKMSKSLPK